MTGPKVLPPLSDVVDFCCQVRLAAFGIDGGVFLHSLLRYEGKYGLPWRRDRCLFLKLHAKQLLAGTNFLCLFQ
jgi:hypothetical protein